MKNFPDPQEVELKLRTIQRDVSPNEARTSLFNLVVYIQDKQELDLMEALNFLHGKRPARVIIVRRGCTGDTHTDISARCVEDHQERGICIQEIVLYSGNDKTGEDPNSWSPILIREIPVFTWWLDKLTPGGEIPGLFEEQSDRCFLDSALAADPLAFYKSLVSTGKLGRIPISDFSWIRLSPLMRLISQLFNPWDLRVKLHNLTSISMTGGLSAEAFLFFQWFKTKLGWTGANALPGQDWKLQNLDGLSVNLSHKSPAPMKNGLKIEFKTKSGEVFSFDSSKEAYATLTAPGHEAYKAIFRVPETGEALLREVDKLSSDRLFLDCVSNV